MPQSLNLKQLIVFLVIGVLSLTLWHTPFLYPIKIFVVFVHEIGHALATILTGGQVVSMVVTPWQSGYVKHVGGNPVLIAAAGYVGSALFGGVLLLLSSRDRWAPAIFLGLSFIFGLATVFFASGVFTKGFGFVSTITFLIFSRTRFPGVHYIVDILAVTSSLYAVYDLTDFLFIGARTDAVMLAEVTPIPAFVWAGLWSLLAIAIVWGAGKSALKRAQPAEPPWTEKRII